MSESLDNAVLEEIESRAVEMAHGAGAILRRYFGSTLDVDYKDEKQTDPVTQADRESQEFLSKEIMARFPEHGIIGEEDEKPEDAVAPDFVWVLDPLDGTKNFLQGLPLFACSIGVLYRGAPVAGAVYVPWPSDGGGVVMHARSGAGAYADGEPVTMVNAPEPEANRLAAVPEFFGGAFRLAKPMRNKVGDVRVTGSIAYELALAARGVVQYSIHSGPHLWDVAGGTVIAREAGGAVMVGRRVRRRMPLAPDRFRWEPLASFLPAWKSGVTMLSELRSWSAPLVVGSPALASYVAEGLERRQPLRRRLSNALRRPKRRPH